MEIVVMQFPSGLNAERLRSLRGWLRQHSFSKGNFKVARGASSLLLVIFLKPLETVFYCLNVVSGSQCRNTESSSQRSQHTDSVLFSANTNQNTNNSIYPVYSGRHDTGEGW